MQLFNFKPSLQIRKTWNTDIDHLTDASRIG